MTPSHLLAAREEARPVAVHLRWLIARDMPAVLAIERASFEDSWTEDDFKSVLRQHSCIGMVAEVREDVVGFMLYELYKPKLHILNFAVHPGWRRREVGAQLLGKLKSKLASHRRSHITLDVRETNLAAQRFFASQGFEAVGVLRGHYEDSGEDAYRMWYWHL